MSHLLRKTSCLSAEEIQTYITGTADDALRFRVENHTLDCPLCAAAVEGYTGAGYPGAVKVQNELHALRERINERMEEIPVRRLSFFNRAVAAGLLVLAVAAIWLYWDHTRDERLFAEHFQPVKSNYLTLRGDMSVASVPELAAAMQMYETGAFEASLPHFANYLAENPADFQVALYAGIAALEAGQTGRTAKWLEAVRLNQPDLYEESTWYLALSLLREGDRAGCAVLLEELSAGKETGWVSKARALLAQIAKE